jgi:hypothetical protein
MGIGGSGSGFKVQEGSGLKAQGSGKTFEHLLDDLA